MTTLREAVQMALDALESVTAEIREEQWHLGLIKHLMRTSEALRAALAQPEQEPTRSQKMRDAGITRRPKGWDKEQELEGINEVILNSIRDSSEVVAPPQREWQGLTEAEHTQIAIDCGCASADWVFYGAAVERKLKEKNT